MATGHPPRGGVPQFALAKEFRLRGAPSLKPEQGYPQGLCDLIAFTLVMDVDKRPTMAEILEHPYLKDSESTYPTSTLKDFVREFQNWAEGGGERQSMIDPRGAQAAKLAEDITSGNEWRFSTFEITELMDHYPDSIDEQLSTRYADNDTHIMSPRDQAADMSSTKAQEDAFNSYHPSEPSSPYLTESDLTPSGSPKFQHNTTSSIGGPSTSAPDGKKVVRGEKQLGRLFDPHKSEYMYSGLNTNQSDLPLRNSTAESSPTDGKGKVIDVNASGTSNSGNIALADPSTLKAKRKDRPSTMAWEFPAEPTGEALEEARSSQQQQHRHPMMSWEFPKPGNDEESQDATMEPSSMNWKFANETPVDHGAEPQSTTQSSMSQEGSDARNMASDDDYGAPSDEAFEDPYIAPYIQPSGPKYPQVSRVSNDTSEGGDRTGNPRQTLDLDAFGAAYDLDHHNEGTQDARQTFGLDAQDTFLDHESDSPGANRTRQTLDLDALMNNMDLNTPSTAAYPTAQTAAESEHSPDIDTPLPDTAPFFTNNPTAPPPPPVQPSSTANNTTANVPRGFQQIPIPTPPSAAAMDPNASTEVLEAEMLRIIEQWGSAVQMTTDNYALLLRQMEEEEANWDKDEEDEEGS